MLRNTRRPRGKLDALGDQGFKEFLRFKDANMFVPLAPSQQSCFLSRASLKCMLMETEYANKEDLVVCMNLSSNK